MHLTLIPRPNQKKREKVEIKRRVLTDSRPKSKGARRVESKDAASWIEKAYFPFFILFLSLHFITIQYGCNSVGYLFSAFLLLYANVSN